MSKIATKYESEYAWSDDLWEMLLNPLVGVPHFPEGEVMVQIITGEDTIIRYKVAGLDGNDAELWRELIPSRLRDRRVIKEIKDILKIGDELALQHVTIHAKRGGWIRFSLDCAIKTSVMVEISELLLS